MLVAVLLGIEVAVVIAGLLLWIVTIEDKALGRLLVTLGAGAAFFTSLAIQYRSPTLHRTRR